MNLNIFFQEKEIVSDRKGFVEEETFVRPHLDERVSRWKGISMVLDIERIVGEQESNLVGTQNGRINPMVGPGPWGGWSWMPDWTVCASF